MKIRNNNYLKQLYKQSYHTGAVYHLAKHKTDELEDKIAEVRRKFKVRNHWSPLNCAIGVINLSFLKLIFLGRQISLRVMNLPRAQQNTCYTSPGTGVQIPRTHVKTGHSTTPALGDRCSPGVHWPASQSTQFDELTSGPGRDLISKE